ncbi:MAG: DUF6263 family protein [Bacteroidota bacterium]
MKKTFTLLLLLVTLGSYAQKSKLELNLQKDSVYNITADVKMDIDQLIQGTHQIIKSTITGVSAHKVLSVQDTLYTFEVTYKSLAMNMALGDKTISFNSADTDTTNMLSRVMHNMTGRSFIMVMSKRGKIVDVKNTENLFKDIFRGFPPIDEQKKAQALVQAQKSFNDKSIKGNFQESFVIFPKAPIGVKSTWSNQASIEAAAISIKTNTIFTLDNVTKDAYEISGLATIEPDKSPEFKSSSQFFMRLINVNGNTTVKATINKKTGWIIKSEIIKHLKGDVELKKTLSEPVMLTYPMVINIDVKSINN